MSVAKEKEKHYKRRRCAMSTEDHGTGEQGNKEHGSKKELSGDRFYLGSIRNIQQGRKSEK